MMEQNLVGVLQAAGGITAALGSAGAIYPMELPEGAVLPALVYRVVGGRGQPSFNTRGLYRARVEINCWGATYAAAVTLRAAVIAALDGYTGQNLSIQFLQPLDFFDHELLQYRAVAEFYVSYPL